MKKISTLILAMGMAASVAATPVFPSVTLKSVPEVKTLSFEKSKVVETNSAKFNRFESGVKLPAVNNMMKAPAKAAANNSIDGEYTIEIGDYYFQGSKGLIETTATIEIFNAEDGIVTLDCENFPTVVPAAYDAESDLIGFVSLEMGQIELVDGQKPYLKLEPYEWVVTDPTTGRGEFQYGTFVISYDSATGEFTIPADHGLSWTLYNDEACETEPMGYLGIFDLVSLYKDIDDPTAWTSVGNATFVDGWVIPAVGDVDQFEFEYEVPLQQNNENKNLFRLVDPYKGNCPVADLNASTKTGYIMFDLSDPDHVIFSVVDAGFANADLGITKMYCYNTLAYYVNATGYTPAEIIELLGDEMPYTTYKDGVITLKSIYDASINEETGKPYGTTYDACFGVQGAKIAHYGWSMQDGTPANMDARITFPTDFNFVPDQSGVDNIVADDANAPVEYFNLQGVKVQNPENGLYIKRQGKTVEKVVIRK